MAIGDGKREGQCYLRVLETNPDVLEAWHNLGVSKYNQGKLNEALQCFERGLQTYPESVSTLAIAADAYDKLGKKNIAIEHYRRAISVQAMQFKAIFEDGDWKVYTGENPDRISAMKELGALLAGDLRADEALECLIAALKHEPRNPALLFDVGVCYALQDDLDTSVRYFNRAFRLAGDEKEVNDWVKWFNDMMKDCTTAKGEYIHFT